MEKKDFVNLRDKVCCESLEYASKVCCSLFDYAQKYAEENNVENFGVIFDSIRFIMSKYKGNIMKEHQYLFSDEYIEPNSLFTFLLNNYSRYIKEGIGELSLLCKKNKNTNEEYLQIIVDFLNFIAKENKLDISISSEDLTNRETKENIVIDKICDSLIEYIKLFRAEQRLGRREDELLVDSVNHLAEEHGVKYQLKTSELNFNSSFKPRVDSNILLTILVDSYQSYINVNKEALEEKLTASHLFTDFLNFIATTNNIDKRFEIEDLYSIEDIVNRLESNKRKIFS